MELALLSQAHGPLGAAIRRASSGLPIDVQRSAGQSETEKYRRVVVDGGVRLDGKG